MRDATGLGFAGGMLAGAAVTSVSCLVGLYVLNALDVVAISVVDLPNVQTLSSWLVRNLGLSLIPFGLTLGLFVLTLRTLSQRLRARAAPERVAQADSMADIWISLFFGIGVIWTAIGMRDALLYALGEPPEIARSGAFVVLQRLVEGGILTALSTTIVGGVGGYLMRLVKAALVGTALNRYYEDLHRHEAEESLVLLRLISDRLAHLAPDKGDGG